MGGGEGRASEEERGTRRRSVGGSECGTERARVAAE